MVCESHKKAKVIYSFGGNESDTRTFETEQTPIRIEVEEYSLPIPGGQCPIPYLVTVRFGHECQKGIPQVGEGVYRVPKGAVLGAQMTTYFPPHDGPNRGSGAEATLIIYYEGGQLGGKFGNNIFGCSGGIGTNKGNYFAEIIDIVPENPNQPDNCGNLKKCRLKVFNSNSNTIIFQDQGDCPCSYLVGCTNCPPETICECDCGDVICCYGSGGEILEVIPK